MDNYMFRPVQPEDGQYRPKHVVVHYRVIKYTSCDTVVVDYIQFSKLIPINYTSFESLQQLA